MPVVDKIVLGGKYYTKEVDGPADHAAVPNDVYFRDKSDGLIRYKNSTGVIINEFVASAFVTAGNLLYVSSTGNDASGRRNEPSNPFLTLEAARDAGSSGDLVVVYPGSYTVTTSDPSGLSLGGINWYFYSGAIVTKSTTNTMFVNSTFSPSNVYGYGSFNVAAVHLNNSVFSNSSITGVFEADSITTASLDPPIFITTNTSNTVHITVRKHITSTLGHAIAINAGNAVLNLNNVSSPRSCIAQFNNVAQAYSTIVNANHLNSTNTNFVVVNAESIHLTANRISGGSFGFSSAGNFGTAVLSVAEMNSIQVDRSQKVTFNGFCTMLHVLHTFSSVIGSTFGGLNMTAGYVDITMDNPTITESVTATVQEGMARLHMKKFGSRQGAVVVTGGEVVITGPSNTRQSVFSDTNLSSIVGGILRFRGDFVFATAVRDLILLSGSVVDLGDSRFVFEAANTPSLRNNLINNQSGRIVTNGATFVMTDVNAWPYRSSIAAGRSHKILSSGLNSNKVSSVLAARSYQERITIDSGQTSASVRINGANQVEPGPLANDVAVAASLTNIINLDAGISVTATHVPGNTFFIITSDIPGNDVTTNLHVNCSFVVIEENSHALNNTTGGVEIFNTDVG